MLRLKEHIISLAAVFFSLGIGLFLGISLGENLLVSNQIEIIEEMEAQLNSYHNQVKELEGEVSLLQEKMGHWYNLEEELFPVVFEDSLVDHNFAIIAAGKRPSNVISFLELTGSDILIVTVKDIEKETAITDRFFFDQKSYLLEDFWSYIMDGQAVQEVSYLLNNKSITVEGDRQRDYTAVLLFSSDSVESNGNTSFVFALKDKKSRFPYVYHFIIDQEGKIFSEGKKESFSFKKIPDSLRFLEKINIELFKNI